MVKIIPDFIAAGGNRHPAAADWDIPSGLLAFGADRNIGVWDPLNTSHAGLHALLKGHSDKVTVVKFLHRSSPDRRFILSGSVDRTLRVWETDTSSPVGFSTLCVLCEHAGTINTCAAEAALGIFASGSADGTVKVWKIELADSGKYVVSLKQTITIKPRFLPLALAISPLTDGCGPLVLAVAGTKNIVQIYVARSTSPSLEFHLQSTLTGHDGWVRSLALTRSAEPGGDLLLASASQDKYIRLWRVHQAEELSPANSGAADLSLGILTKSLSNKAIRFEAEGLIFSVTFEALLLGHDDWIYTAAWHLDRKRLRLLTASADNTLAIWEIDQSSGVWLCVTRLGEISGQKGSTSATGSSGGFWVGLWSPAGEAVVSLGRSGSWRLWNYEEEDDRWLEGVAISGHIKEVTGIAWAKDGSYLLSTGSDQTTRLFAEWWRAERRSWHEVARPQIHGYDLNCIDSISRTQFISGADEKLLRVFDEPGFVAQLLDRIGGFAPTTHQDMPDAADMPVLGLSNKATQITDQDENNAQGEDEDGKAVEGEPSDGPSNLNLSHPPLEGHLARHTLWPEREKLYGHGYEVSTVATSGDSFLVATACRASSVDHAVIRLFETQTWREIKPPLKFHSLTITRLQFSEDDRYLLSVGRDRQWAVFERSERKQGAYNIVASNSKAHARMILDASWTPVDAGRVFATAGRDKLVKVWRISDLPGPIEIALSAVILAALPTTAVAFMPQVSGGWLQLAVGLENGAIQIHALERETLAVADRFVVEERIVPSRLITQLSWRPLHMQLHEDSPIRSNQLAVASEDGSVRLYAVDVSPTKA